MKKIKIDEVITLLQNCNARFEIEGETSIIYYYERFSNDRTRIEICNNGDSISVEGRIFGELSDLKEWIYRGI